MAKLNFREASATCRNGLERKAKQTVFNTLDKLIKKGWFKNAQRL